jgi:hypothetical protein
LALPLLHGYYHSRHFLLRLVETDAGNMATTTTTEEDDAAVAVLVAVVAAETVCVA